MSQCSVSSAPKVSTVTLVIPPTCPVLQHRVSVISLLPLYCNATLSELLKRTGQRDVTLAIQKQLPPQRPLPPATQVPTYFALGWREPLPTQRRDQKCPSTRSHHSRSRCIRIRSHSRHHSHRLYPCSSSSRSCSSWSHQKSGTSSLSAVTSSALIMQWVMRSVENGIFSALRHLRAVRMRSCRTGAAFLKSSISNSRDVSFGKVGTSTGPGAFLSSSLGTCAPVPLPLSLRLLLCPFLQERRGRARTWRRLIDPGPWTWIVEISV